MQHKMLVTCENKSGKKTYQVVYKTSFKYLFLDFVNLKQNVNAQHFMHVKNHKHHTNYFYFNCELFQIEFSPCNFIYL